MACDWPAGEGRELFIRFLELEALLAGKASKGETDPALLRELNDFLKERLPKTGDYIEKSFRGERLAKAADIEKIAWVESRAHENESGVARVAGTWTPDEIAADIEACRRTALKKSR